MNIHENLKNEGKSRENYKHREGLILERLWSKSGLFHRVGGDQSTTFNVTYPNVCHSLKFMNLPRYSGHCWFELRNPRWRS